MHASHHPSPTLDLRLPVSACDPTTESVAATQCVIAEQNDQSVDTAAQLIGIAEERHQNGRVIERTNVGQIQGQPATIRFGKSKLELHTFTSRGGKRL
jgi:hypothetical protein